jgi:hypothetical protein
VIPITRGPRCRNYVRPDEVAIRRNAYRGLLLAAAALQCATNTSLAHAQSADPVEWADARPALARGEALFTAHNYGAALVEFSAAYRLLDGHPRQYLVLSNVAVCHERLFHYDVATTYYERYLKEGGARVEDSAEIEIRLRSLHRLLATLTIASNVPADVWVDDRHVGRAPGSIRVSPGKHLVELRATIHESARQEVDVAAGTSLRLHFELGELSQYSGLSSSYFWTFTGLTVAALGVGTGFAIAAVQSDSDGRARAEQHRFLNTVEDEASIRRAAATADVAFGAAALLGASATILFFLTDWQDRPPPTPRTRAARRRLEPYAGADLRTWQLGLRGAL